MITDDGYIMPSEPQQKTPATSRSPSSLPAERTYDNNGQNGQNGHRNGHLNGRYREDLDGYGEGIDEAEDRRSSTTDDDGRFGFKDVQVPTLRQIGEGFRDRFFRSGAQQQEDEFSEGASDGWLPPPPSSSSPKGSMPMKYVSFLSSVGWFCFGGV